MKKDHLYMQIYRDLKTGIDAGAYPPGAQLPSEHDLSRRYCVTRDTVRRALELLAHEGLIRKQPGRGSFVCSDSDAVTFQVDPVHLKNPILSDLLFQLSKQASHE